MERSVSGPTGFEGASLFVACVVAGGPARDVGLEGVGRSTGVVHENLICGTHVSEMRTEPDAATLSSGRFPPSAAMSSFFPGHSL